VLVTHDVELAAFADEIIALRDGRVVEHRVDGNHAVPPGAGGGMTGGGAV
jgi:hypothetical protein